MSLSPPYMPPFIPLHFQCTHHW